MSKEKIIKVREPGPEFQALASDWKPTKRRAWLVQPTAIAAVPATAELAVAAKPAEVTNAEVAVAAEPAVAATQAVAAGSDAVAVLDAGRAIAVSAATSEPALAAGLAIAASLDATADVDVPASAELAATPASAVAAVSAATPESAVAADAVVTTKVASPPNADQAVTSKSAATANMAVHSDARASFRFAPAGYGANTPVVPFTKAPNLFWDQIYQLDLSVREMRVLLYLARQTFGYHRASIALSAADIGLATRIHKSHIATTIRDLIAGGHILKESGGGRERNIYLISPSLGGLERAADTKSHFSGTTNRQNGISSGGQNGGITSSQVGGTAESCEPNENAELNVNSPQPKKLKESSERNSLSPMPVAWKRYTDTLTERSRERAVLIFEGLMQRFPEDNPHEIAACPENLRTFGAPDGTPWTEIKSPHGLMEIAWPQLRDFYRAKHAARRRTVVAQAADQQRETAEDVALAKAAEIARTAFASAFPDEGSQMTALDRFKPQWVSNAHTEPGRSVTIDAWFRATGGAVR